jgi:hypothetical protein
VKRHTTILIAGEASAASREHSMCCTCCRTLITIAHVSAAKQLAACGVALQLGPIEWQVLLLWALPGSW